MPALQTCRHSPDTHGGPERWGAWVRHQRGGRLHKVHADGGLARPVDRKAVGVEHGREVDDLGYIDGVLAYQIQLVVVLRYSPGRPAAHAAHQRHQEAAGGCHHHLVSERARGGLLVLGGGHKLWRLGIDSPQHIEEVDGREPGHGGQQATVGKPAPEGRKGRGGGSLRGCLP